MHLFEKHKNHNAPIPLKSSFECTFIAMNTIQFSAPKLSGTMTRNNDNVCNEAIARFHNRQEGERVEISGIRGMDRKQFIKEALVQMK